MIITDESETTDFWITVNNGDKRVDFLCTAAANAIFCILLFHKFLNDGT